jgi:DNA-binding GntR family transcriptional regulator
MNIDTNKLTGIQRKSPLAKQIYTSLKEKILLMEYPPGQILQEKELADQFGIGKTPVREALIYLEAEGLVERVPYGTTHVAEIDFAKLRDTFELRNSLIEIAGQWASKRVTEEELKQMEDIVQRMENETDPKNLMRLDSEFHELINEATGNQMLCKALGMLRYQAMRVWALARDKSFTLEFAEDFRETIKALKERNSSLTKRLLRRHAEKFIHEVRKQL